MMNDMKTVIAREAYEGTQPYLFGRQYLTIRSVVQCVWFVFLVSCANDPVEPGYEVPPSFAQQVEAWKPTIVFEEPLVGNIPSGTLYTLSRGDTVTSGIVRFRIDSANAPDSAIWTFRGQTYTLRQMAVTDIPEGTHELQGVISKRFRSAREYIDSFAQRTVQRSVVSVNYGESFAIGKWVAVDPGDIRIDTLKVLYQDIVPGLPDTVRRTYVIGATRGCDHADPSAPDMAVSLRRYAVNFRRESRGGGCPLLQGELILASRNVGLYRFRQNNLNRIDSVPVRRAQ